MARTKPVLMADVQERVAALSAQVRAEMWAALTESGVSQPELAEQMGVTISRVKQLWSRGTPTIPTLVRVLTVLGYELKIQVVKKESE